ncbi:MAG: AAA family ATPase, partial [Victivallales bacterium]|nr:AAA family ATPase [Victivallales bacterium]
MSLLSTITKGRENKPPRLFVYGQEGVGKSLFSASAPNPIFVQTEDGLGEIDTAKFPLAKNLADVTSAMTALRDEPHDFQTVVHHQAEEAQVGIQGSGGLLQRRGGRQGRILRRKPAVVSYDCQFVRLDGAWQVENFHACLDRRIQSFAKLWMRRPVGKHLCHLGHG